MIRSGWRRRRRRWCGWRRCWVSRWWSIGSAQPRELLHDAPGLGGAMTKEMLFADQKQGLGIREQELGVAARRTGYDARWRAQVRRS